MTPCELGGSHPYVVYGSLTSQDQCRGRQEGKRAGGRKTRTWHQKLRSKIRAYSFAPYTSATMRIRSAIVVGSFAAASGAYPQLSIPPEAGKGANSKWHLPPRISPARRRHGWPERCARAAARPRAARRAKTAPIRPQASRPSPAATPSRQRRTSRSCDRRPSAFERPLPLAPTPATRPRRSVRRLTTRDTTAP